MSKIQNTSSHSSIQGQEEKQKKKQIKNPSHTFKCHNITVYIRILVALAYKSQQNVKPILENYDWFTYKTYLDGLVKKENFVQSILCCQNLPWLEMRADCFHTFWAMFTWWQLKSLWNTVSFIMVWRTERGTEVIIPIHNFEQDASFSKWSVWRTA